MCASQLYKDTVAVVVEDSFEITGWLCELYDDEDDECFELYDPDKFDEKMLELVNKLKTTIDRFIPGQHICDNISP